MKKLKTDEGIGYPIRLDQLNAVHNDIEAIIAGLCKTLASLPNDNHGLLVSGNIELINEESNKKFKCDNSYIYFSNKIYYLPAQEWYLTNGNNGTIYFEPQTIPELPLQYKDGQTRPTLQYDIMIPRETIIGGSIPNGCLYIYYIRQLKDIWLNNKLKQGIQLTLNNSFDGFVFCDKDILGQLHIYGSFNVLNRNTDILTTLPSDYRARLWTMPIYAYSNTDIKILLVNYDKVRLHNISSYDLNVTYDFYGIVTPFNY